MTQKLSTTKFVSRGPPLNPRSSPKNKSCKLWRVQAKKTMDLFLIKSLTHVIRNLMSKRILLAQFAAICHLLQSCNVMSANISIVIMKDACKASMNAKINNVRNPENSKHQRLEEFWEMFLAILNSKILKMKMLNQ